jgi:pimeloyl-ACP methyl ester carboxylesterase
MVSASRKTVRKASAMSVTSIYKNPRAERNIQATYTRALEAWPVEHIHLHLPTRFGETFVIASGQPSAPPLILLHGAGSNSSSWAGDIKAYAQHFRVYAVDLLGEPGRSAPSRPDWNSAGYAEWLEDVLNGLHVTRAMLLGLSQGAWTALQFATLRPERVEKLVLLTPGGIVPDKLSFVFQALPLTFLGSWGIKRLARLLFAGKPIPPQVEASMLETFSGFKPRLGVLPIFADDALRALPMPVLAMIGTHDALRDGEKIVSRLRTLVPNFESALIPGAGHALIHTHLQTLPFLTKV